MKRFAPKNEDVPMWPLDEFIVVRFPDDDSNYHAVRAAMIKVTAELKECINRAAATLAANKTLRTIQFYWPLDIVTNRVHEQPILSKYARAIVALLNSNFRQAVPSKISREAIQRVALLDAITWISVGRHPLGDCGEVELGCTQFCFHKSTTIRALTPDVTLPMYEPVENYSQRLMRAITDIGDFFAGNGVEKP